MNVEAIILEEKLLLERVTPYLVPSGYQNMQDLMDFYARMASRVGFEAAQATFDRATQVSLN